MYKYRAPQVVVITQGVVLLCPEVLGWGVCMWSMDSGCSSTGGCPLRGCSGQLSTAFWKTLPVPTPALFSHSPVFAFVPGFHVGPTASLCTAHCLQCSDCAVCVFHWFFFLLNFWMTFSCWAWFYIIDTIKWICLETWLGVVLHSWLKHLPWLSYLG